MSYDVTSDEYLQIGDVPLHTPAWEIESLAPLWRGPAVRGEDDRIPGASGVRPNMRRPDITPVLLVLSCNGYLDWEGNTYPDPRRGLAANIQHLRDNVIDPTLEGDGTRDATLTMPNPDPDSGDEFITRTAAVHVLGWEFEGEGPYGVSGTLGLSIPGGALR